MNHVVSRIDRPAASIVKAFSSLGAATVYEASGRKGYVDCSIKPLSRGTRICGPAFTVQCAPGDNLMLHKALQIAQEGDVLVTSVGGSEQYGYFGAMMATAGIARGIGGLAIEGDVRDSAEMDEMGFPVFCKGFCIRGTTKSSLGLINHPINFGLISVSPGDIILGDDDGLVIIRKEDCEEILKKSLERVEYEEKKAAQLRGGISSVELNNLEKVFEALRMGVE